jgi:hypothetical protein
MIKCIGRRDSCTGGFRSHNPEKDVMDMVTIFKSIFMELVLMIVTETIYCVEVSEFRGMPIFMQITC